MGKRSKRGEENDKMGNGSSWSKTGRKGEDPMCAKSRGQMVASASQRDHDACDVPPSNTEDRHDNHRAKFFQIMQVVSYNFMSYVLWMCPALPNIPDLDGPNLMRNTEIVFPVLQAMNLKVLISVFNLVILLRGYA
ncbi:conserved hypothetical protein [Ricinus communis]|uniref:Transmembrane protein n=1 Tax=Ricinus communis TaxID=3988 RepID=B9R9A6_RICCO|nr:conserved hypothetical protein [Ricinus communis]